MESDVPYFLGQELRKGYLDGIEGVYHTLRAILSQRKTLKVLPVLRSLSLTKRNLFFPDS